jgi:hypothetical protein
LKKKIIPLLYRKCEIPFNYLNLNYIDVQEQNYSQNFPRILKALGRASRNPLADVTRAYPKRAPATRAPASKSRTGSVLAILGGGAILLTCVGVLVWVIGSYVLGGGLPISLSLADTPSPSPALQMGGPAATLAGNPTSTAMSGPTLSPESMPGGPTAGNSSASQPNGFEVDVQYLPAVPASAIEALKSRLEQFGYQVTLTAFIPEQGRYYSPDNRLMYGNPDCLKVITDIQIGVADIVNLSMLSPERFSSIDQSYQSYIIALYFADASLFTPSPTPTP